MSTTVKSKCKGLTGEGLQPSPPQRELTDDYELPVWMVGNGTSVNFHGGRYRKVVTLPEPENQTKLLGAGDIEIMVGNETIVTIIKEN